MKMVEKYCNQMFNEMSVTKENIINTYELISKLKLSQ